MNLLKEILRYSYKRKSDRRRRLVLRMNQIHEWDYGIEAAWRCARVLPE